MINRPFTTLVYREVLRFMVLYKQTLMPGIISSALYLIIWLCEIVSESESEIFFNHALSASVKIDFSFDKKKFRSKTYVLILFKSGLIKFFI